MAEKHTEKSAAAGDRMARPDKGTSLNVTENRTPLQADEGSCGDFNRKTPGNEQPTSAAEEKSREHHTGEKKESETVSLPTLSEGKDDQVDGPREESPDTNLAAAFSTSLNASVLHVDRAGRASRASQDSDQVKLDINSKLQGAFEGDKPIAVINRFEELPPCATLIFNRYCDHENAAYKKTCLMSTVLLGEEEEIPAEARLCAVEEMVDDHLQKKFLSDGLPVAFDRMDLDKYSGLWSHISHLILPVAAERRIELEGC